MTTETKLVFSQMSLRQEKKSPEDHLSITLLPLPFTFLSRLIGTISWHKSKEKMTFWALFYILVVNFRPAQVSRTPQNQFRKH